MMKHEKQKERKYYTHGCHWSRRGKGHAPSFYPICYREQIVIVPNPKWVGDCRYTNWNKGDRILLISGQQVNGVAEILDSTRIDSSTIPKLEEQFAEYSRAEPPEYNDENRNNFLFYTAKVVSPTTTICYDKDNFCYQYQQSFFPIKNLNVIAK